MSSPRPLTDLALYRRVLRWVRPFRVHIAGIFLLSLLATPLTLLAPVPLKIVVDSVLGDHPLPGFLEAILPGSGVRPDGQVLGLAVGLLVAIAVLTRLRAVGSTVLDEYTTERVALGFRADLFRRAQRLSFAYHDARGTADSLYRIQYDATAIPSIAIHRIIPFITAAFMLVSMLTVMLRLDWHLGLVAVAISPVLFLLSRIYRQGLRRRWSEVKDLESHALSVLQEVMGALRVVKAFGREEHERERFIHRSRQGLRARLRVSWTSGLLLVLIGLTTSLGTAAVLLLGVHQIQAGALTLGDLLIMMGYLGSFYDPLQTLSTQGTRLQSSLAGAERAFALLDAETDVPDPPGRRALVRCRGEVGFDHVSYAYVEGSPVLRDVHFAVPAGASVGIAGPTGAGKSTLLSLLIRFEDPTSGRITLDGVDLRDYRLADLRRQFAIVLQEPVLFSASVEENIAYARPDASREDIMAAARAAYAHEFISRLPEGYDTPVGERGLRLSGGERQRISLARAFLRDAPVLLLDEPTSSVDRQTEDVILDALQRLMAGRTTFMIAHRLGTLDRCNLRFELDGGQMLDATPAGSTLRG